MMAANLVDTPEAVVKVVDGIVDAIRTPLIFVDLEGINLSRQGSISLMQILLPPAPVVHLLDLFSLQDQTFTTAGTAKKTLKDILQSEQYIKVFFDVRNDSDALFSHHGVDLNGVVDLQLMEYASRPRAGRFIKGLAKCISEDYSWTSDERHRWNLVKEAGQKLFAPEKGGSYSVFNERPLLKELVEYCIQDVLALPRLLCKYADRLGPHMVVQVLGEGRRRVAESQGVSFNGTGRHMALAPSFQWARYSDTSMDICLY
jgi:exonuclease 3'-5' domain-containing protein 1